MQNRTPPANVARGDHQRVVLSQWLISCETVLMLRLLVQQLFPLWIWNDEMMSFQVLRQSILNARSEFT